MPASSVPWVSLGAAGPRRRRRRGRAGWALAALFTVAFFAGPSRADELPAAEPTPVAELGPPHSPGAAVQSTAEGVTIRIHPSRRSAEVLARWRLRAAPGLLQLTVPSNLRPVTFSILGRAPAPAGTAPEQVSGPEPPAELERTGVAVADVVPLDEALPPVPQLGIDPQSTAIYTLPLPATPTADPAQLRQPARSAYYLTVEIPPGGEVTLQACATLSSGFDRKRWRRTHFEQAHALQKRKDPFVYQFAVRGPAGPVGIQADAGTTAQTRVIDGVLHASAAARRPPGVGLTLGLGPAIAAPPPPEGQGMAASGLLVQGLVRAALEVLLPHRDAVALSLELGSDLQDGHHAGAALVYQLYTPAWAYLPLGGHLDVGASCDLWQSRGIGLGLAGAESLRCGGRLGLTANVGFIGIAPSVDIFPPLRELTAGSAETRFTAQYRVAILVTVGL